MVESRKRVEHPLEICNGRRPEHRGLIAVHIELGDLCAVLLVRLEVIGEILQLVVLDSESRQLHQSTTSATHAREDRRFLRVHLSRTLEDELEGFVLRAEARKRVAHADDEGVVVKSELDELGERLKHPREGGNDRAGNPGQSVTLDDVESLRRSAELAVCPRMSGQISICFTDMRSAGSAATRRQSRLRCRKYTLSLCRILAWFSSPSPFSSYL